MTHVVIFSTSFMLVRGSELSGQRSRQGAKMMARAPGDMRFTSSSRATLWSQQLGGDHLRSQCQALVLLLVARTCNQATGHNRLSCCGEGHLLDKVEDESLQGGVVGLRQVVQDCIDGSQLLLLLWQLWGGQGYQSWVEPAMPSPPSPCTSPRRLQEETNPTQTTGHCWSRTCSGPRPSFMAHQQP